MDIFNQPIEGKINGITSSAMKILLNHDYPGNVRELENIIEHAFILCRENYITAKNLPEYLSNRLPAAPVKGNQRQLIDNFEKKLIEETLKQHGGNLQRAAKALGIHRSTLWRKMKKNNITATKNQ